MRSALAKFAAVTATVLSVAVVAAPAANAEGYRTSASCGATPQSHAEASLNAFAGHSVHAYVRVCQNGSVIKWATQPVLSYPSRFNPAAIIESVSTATSPYIYSYGNSLNGFPQRITWKFDVKQGIKGAEVSTFAFVLRAYPAYLELCLGATCTTTGWTLG